MTLGSLVGTAAVTGLLGSWHCAAMCGPLAVAGCRGGRATMGYLGGRLVAYAALGALMGHLGWRAARASSLSTLQIIALVGLAAAAAVRGALLWRRAGRAALVPLRAGPPRRSTWSWLLAALPRRGLGLGLITGLLPCGLLMTGWLLAAAAGSPGGGALIMLTLWTVTLPGLLAPLLGGRLLARRLARIPPRAAAAAWLALAVWIALRPLLAAVRGESCH